MAESSVMAAADSVGSAPGMESDWAVPSFAGVGDSPAEEAAVLPLLLATSASGPLVETGADVAASEPQAISPIASATNGITKNRGIANRTHSIWNLSTYT